MMLTLGLFTDAHYAVGLDTACKTRLCSRSVDKLHRVLRAMSERGVDAVVNLGDLINGTGDAARDLASLDAICAPLGTLSVPVLHTVGNHDAFALPKRRIMPVQGEAGCVAETNLGGVTFLTLDSCFNAAQRPYDALSDKEKNWKDTALPAAQLAWLEERLAAAPGEVVILCHAVLAPRVGRDGQRNPHVLDNAEAVRSLLERSGRVRQVFCGHEHCGYRSEHHGVTYDGLPALCEGAGAAFALAELDETGWRVERLVLAGEEV